MTTIDHSQVIVALDVRGKQDALELVNILKPVGLRHVKVGMSLFYEAGLPLLEALSNDGLDVFVDLKLHDIPNTVARTVDVLIKGGARFLNIHCLGGQEMMRRASEQAHHTCEDLGVAPVNLIGVTVLTSHDQTTLTDDLACRLDVPDMVTHLASQAKACGLDGVVCSPLEAKALRHVLGADFLKVTPGIRPEQQAMAAFKIQDDQARIMTPRRALEAGATHIVIGRPIYEEQDPAQALKDVFTSLE